jgi:hypothetical protein
MFLSSFFVYTFRKIMYYVYESQANKNKNKNRRLL